MTRQQRLVVDLMQLARLGTPFGRIARLLDLSSEEAVRTLWRRYRCADDMQMRHEAIVARAAAAKMPLVPPAPTTTQRWDGVRFEDDPRAVADHGWPPTMRALGLPLQFRNSLYGSQMGWLESGNGR